ncbi:hypothetical protein ACLOJK_017581 [Asimina triloba]
MRLLLDSGPSCTSSPPSSFQNRAVCGMLYFLWQSPQHQLPFRFKGDQPNCVNPAKSCFNASSSVHLYGVLPSTVNASGLPPSCKVIAHANVLKPCRLSQI